MPELKATPIIGLIGLDCAGKTTVAEYLQGKHKYEYHSLSDAIREEATKLGLDHKVETLTALGRELRQKEGNSVLAERILKKLQPNTKYVIDSIRHPDEVQSLMKKPRFVPITVEAPLLDRWERFNKRKREGEKISLEDFARRDSGAFFTENAGQQIGLCMPMTRYILVNPGKYCDYLYDQIEELLTKLERPSWDKYFFDITDVVAERSNCDRGKSGALIVKDKHIISAGYVGAPPGLPSCDEVGHKLEKRYNADGTFSEHCVRTVHCEENALLDAAKRGVTVDGSILYISMEPCPRCAKMLITAGIKEIKVRKRYQRGTESAKILEEGKVKLTRLQDDVQMY